MHDRSGNTDQRARLAAYKVDAEARRRGCLASERGWSWARLGVFVGSVLGWFWLSSGYVVAGTVVLFGACVWRHLRARARRELADRLVLMIAESGQRVGGRVVTVRSGRRPEGSHVDAALDDGEIWTLTAQERDDLDLYGEPVGLFGLLNRTATALGARRLRDRCEHACLSTDRIEARQACVRWLDGEMERRLRVMAGLAILRGRDARLEAFVEAVRGATPLPSPGRTRFLRLWSIVTAVFLCVAVVKVAMGVPGWLGALLIVVMVNAAVSQQMSRDLRQRLGAWRDVAYAVRGLRSSCERAARDLPDETELGLLRRRFADVISPDVLPALTWRLDFTNTGGAVHAMLNIVLFYDLHTAAAILGKAVPHREVILASVSAMAELDALLSVACFGYEQPIVTYPSVTQERGLSIIGGVHPLVSPEKVVGNNLELSAESRVRVITGSNMAGKSTYLRMLGVSTLLAQLGSAVPAVAMRFSPMRLVSDLRIRDELSKEESYFMAEVRQIRRMLLPPSGDVPLLGLIDEPFRGTNSVERIAASVAVVRQLVDSGHFFVVATHEHQLTELADGQVTVNCHFAEHLGRDGAVFDYALQPGPAMMRNALLILEREGFPAAVLERARDWLARDDGSERS